MAEVSMDYEAVEAMADGFADASEVLEAVSAALEVAIGILKTIGLFGGPGTMAMRMYLENIKPNVDRLAATCDELHYDLLGAISSMRDGDMTGSQRFV